MTRSARHIFAIGLSAALLGNIAWGLYPPYFKAIGLLSPLEVMDLRLIGACIFLLAFMPFSNRMQQFIAAVTNIRVLATLAVTACLIATNWLVYIWAVDRNLVLQASLGYYLSPILSVLLARVVLKEPQNRLQLIAFILASMGVALKVVLGGIVPWVAICLAVSFSFYGLLRKQTQVGPLTGLFIETLILTPFAILHMLYLWNQGDLVFLVQAPPTLNLLVLAIGFVTAMPLFLYNVGAKSLPLALVSMLFFLVPTLLFIQATLIYKEPVTTSDLCVFALIGLAVLLYFLGLGSKNSNA